VLGGRDCEEGAGNETGEPCRDEVEKRALVSASECVGEGANRLAGVL